MPSANHFPPRTPPWGTKGWLGGWKSRARWALDPGGALVLFVHGFGGDAVSTWTEFADMLVDEASCAHHDFLFYGYDGLRIRADPSGAELLRLLEALGSAPADEVVNPSLLRTQRRPRTFQYQSIVVVAHSLGAVVTRLALLKAARRRPPAPWLGKVRFVLFAPAHTGAEALSLAREVLGVFPLAVAKIGSRVLRDLEPGSRTLVDLQADTVRGLAIRGAPREHLVARRVVAGERDDVVSPARFCEDPDPVYLKPPNAGHVSVCKPRPGALAPLRQVLGCL